MAKERIEVVERFLEYSNTSHTTLIRRKALGNAYSLAARLVYFDGKVPGLKYLLKAFKLRRGWPERLTLIQVLFIVSYPLSGLALLFFKKVFK
jgi:hypothetical protein